MSRREKLEEMLAESPADQFLRYGLANELKKEGEFEQSVVLYRGLMADAPPHIASFLMAAQVLESLERIDDAREVLRIGIEEARRQDELHAAGEMGELLASF